MTWPRSNVLTASWPVAPTPTPATSDGGATRWCSPWSAGRRRPTASARRGARGPTPTPASTWPSRNSTPTATTGSSCGPDPRPGSRCSSACRARPGDAGGRASRTAVLDDAAARISRSLPVEGLAALLERNLEHPRWAEVADRCLSCGNCTSVCPTCFCSDVHDTSALDGTVERQRTWASCFDRAHSAMHGVTIRPTTSSCYRQWLTHKLSTWWDQFGTSGCVGCGRCLTWCPVGIDLTEEVPRHRGDRRCDACLGDPVPESMRDLIPPASPCSPRLPGRPGDHRGRLRPLNVVFDAGRLLLAEGDEASTLFLVRRGLRGHRGAPPRAEWASSWRRSASATWSGGPGWSRPTGGRSTPGRGAGGRRGRRRRLPAAARRLRSGARPTPSCSRSPRRAPRPAPGHPPAPPRSLRCPPGDR